MLPGDSTASVYTDFAGLAALRAQAQSKSPEALAEVAAQFEALMLQMMLKSMRATTGGDPLLGEGGQLYTELLDQQMALELAGSNGIGLADILAKQLGALPGYSPKGAAEPFNPSRSTMLPKQVRDHTEPVQHPTAAGLSLDEALQHSPSSFVRTLWPHAERAGQALGVDPRLLIAQAALETGWGKGMIRDAWGNSSHNLFGIKADARWSGARIEVPTLEHMDGFLTRTRAPFRSYASVAESFDDYAKFVGTQSHYRDAVAQAADPKAYIRALHKAGYATDPEYADKVLTLMNHPELSESVTASGPPAAPSDG